MFGCFSTKDTPVPRHWGHGLVEEKSSWNTQKKSNEGAQVKKGLKTPYCRVGERPGLRVYIYLHMYRYIHICVSNIEEIVLL